MPSKGFIVTGRAAHERIARLFNDLVNETRGTDCKQLEWVDLSPYALPTTPSQTMAAAPDIKVEFIWENSPRHATKTIRDSVSVYSHLPNGTSVLDDKWVLARLLGSSFVDASKDVTETKIDKKETANKELATLESHCFRGADFVKFANRVGLLSEGVPVECNSGPCETQCQFEDLIQSPSNNTNHKFNPPPAPDNLWVIKDAMSNGAGGIWIMDSDNIDEFLDKDTSESDISGASANNGDSVLHPDHRYIAQRYSWPPVLYGGRKCHIRVYGCINAKGEAFVHRRAFLHVANNTFQYKKDKSERFESSVHITNCCANSHDAGKFAGEICANLLETESSEVVGLGAYFRSIAASVAQLAQKSAPFLKGGRANNGFEYLGMDFVLSSFPDSSSSERIPVAYLLEVNAPPSQDTATGLPHAENLHDEVISDLLRMCVLPELGLAERNNGGWECVYQPKDESDYAKDAVVVPSKAAFVNRVRWNLFEKKAVSEYELHWAKLTAQQSSKCESLTDSFDHDTFTRLARSQFPYFSSSKEVFLESGGGAQVPKIVMDSMLASLSHRDRSVVGANSLRCARTSLLSLLTGEVKNPDEIMMFMGPNATSLLERLPQMFTDGLQEGDEIILASENHLANVLPWITLAKHVGARVKWWTVTDIKNDTSIEDITYVAESSVLSDLVTHRTKVVAISHSSNILGCARDVPSICQLVHRKTLNQAQVIVDGVAAAPHMISPDIFEGGPDSLPDWYAVSLHKMFGPHIGCLIGKKCSARQLLQEPCESVPYKQLETGTMNYEACAGVSALYEYFKIIGSNDIQYAKKAIHRVESSLVKCLLLALSNSSPAIRIIHDLGHQRVGYKHEQECVNGLARLPFVSFVHSTISANRIVEHCRIHGVICRACKFLSTDKLWKELGIGEGGAVRFSLAHYNTTHDIARAIEVLKMMDAWA